MSKMAAIDTAVRHQLVREKGGRIDYAAVLGSPSPAPAPAAYGYDVNSIQLFLINVANRLRIDDPPLIFNWGALDPTRALDGTLEILINQVATATTSGDAK